MSVQRLMWRSSTHTHACRPDRVPDSQYMCALSAAASWWFIKPSALGAPASSSHSPRGGFAPQQQHQQQMARNRPSLCRQITHTPRSRHCQASFTSAAPQGGSPHSLCLFVREKLLIAASDIRRRAMSSVWRIIQSLNLEIFSLGGAVGDWWMGLLGGTFFKKQSFSVAPLKSLSLNVVLATLTYTFFWSDADEKSLLTCVHLYVW